MDGLDIGPQSIKIFKMPSPNVKQLFGMTNGVFEFDKFAEGTNAIATTLADLSSSQMFVRLLVVVIM